LNLAVTEEAHDGFKETLEYLIDVIDWTLHGKGASARIGRSREDRDKRPQFGKQWKLRSTRPS
jgi:hypothetical protein